MKKIIRAMINHLKRFGALRYVLKQKNMQICAEREKYQAERAANSILTAYVFYLASQHGVVRIPKAEISALLGKCDAHAYSDGDDYVIEVKISADSGEEATCGKTRNVQGLV